MAENIILPEDAGLILKKLVEEPIPVVAYAVFPDGSVSKLDGFVDSATFAVGIVIAAKQRLPAESSNLQVRVGSSVDDIEYSFGDKRDLDPEIREALAEKYGDTTLSIRVKTTGTRLAIFFNSLK